MTMQPLPAVDGLVRTRRAMRDGTLQGLSRIATPHGTAGLSPLGTSHGRVCMEQGRMMRVEVPAQVWDGPLEMNDGVVESLGWNASGPIAGTAFAITVPSPGYYRLDLNLGVNTSRTTTITVNVAGAVWWTETLYAANRLMGEIPLGQVERGQPIVLNADGVDISGGDVTLQRIDQAQCLAAPIPDPSPPGPIPTNHLYVIGDGGGSLLGKRQKSNGTLVASVAVQLQTGSNLACDMRGGALYHTGRSLGTITKVDISDMSIEWATSSIGGRVVAVDPDTGVPWVVSNLDDNFGRPVYQLTAAGSLTDSWPTNLPDVLTSELMCIAAGSGVVVVGSGAGGVGGSASFGIFDQGGSKIAEWLQQSGGNPRSACAVTAQNLVLTQTDNLLQARTLGGSLVWQQSGGARGTTAHTGLRVNASGQIASTGDPNSTDTNTAKRAANGNPIWTISVAGQGIDIDENGIVFACRNTTAGNYLRRLHEDTGATVWSTSRGADCVVGP